MKFNLGQPVMFSIVFERAVYYNSNNWRACTKKWKRVHLPIVQKGIVVGLRTVFDGIVTWGVGEDAGKEWCPKASHKVALVVTDIRKNHIIVPIEALHSFVDIRSLTIP